MLIHLESVKTVLMIGFITQLMDTMIDTNKNYVFIQPKKKLKVLDEIQTSIMTEHQFRIDELNCTRNYFGKEYKEIYQMPQDEDVEV